MPFSQILSTSTLDSHFSKHLEIITFEFGQVFQPVLVFWNVYRIGYRGIFHNVLVDKIWLNGMYLEMNVFGFVWKWIHI